MLYETLLQGKIFLCFLYFGIVAGIFLSIKQIIDKMTKKNKVIMFFSDFAICIFFTLLFLFCVNKFNYGQFRLYEILGFFSGVILQQISLNKIVEKILNLIYTFLCKMFCHLKKLKFFDKILK